MKTQVDGKFHELTFEEQVNHMKEVGRRALACWGYPQDTKMKLLNYTENATFSVESINKPKIIMRVHRLDYVSYNSIRTELQWIMDLKKDTDIMLASPLKSQEGNYVETIESPELEEKRFVVCFSFMEGTAPCDQSDNNEGVSNIIQKMDKIPKAITIPLFRKAAVVFDFLNKKNTKSKMSFEDRRLYRQMGIVAAKLHKQSKEWKQPEYFERLTWDFEGTFGEGWNNFYGESYRSDKWLSQKDIQILDRCVDLMEMRLQIYGKSKDRYGIIHSDLRTANLLKKEDRIGVLDFDDCGKGWYMYEIAGIVALIEHRADLNEILDEIVKGYEMILPLSIEDKTEIKTFIMMRRIGMLESLIARIGCVMLGSGESAQLTPEILAFYAKGTVLLAKKYVLEYEEQTQHALELAIPVHA